MILSLRTMKKSPDILSTRTDELIAFFKESNTNPFFHTLLEKGPKGFLEDLRCPHVQGLHDVIPEHELEKPPKDPTIEEGQYLAWWNVKAG